MSPIDLNYAKSFLLDLLNTPSPTGNTSAAISLVESVLQQLNISTQRTVKGALLATLPGKTNAPARAITGHVDTLGGMVKEIKKDGRLSISAVGGYYAGSIVGEYCTVETESGAKISGTVLLEKQSVHIHAMDKVHETARNLHTIEVRLDARTNSYEDTVKLGIQVGDFISWDSRTQVTENGFIKSRHLDDKAGVASMIAAAQAIKTHGITPAHTTYLYFSTYEEVGHGGASGIPDDVEELLVVDMGVLGEGQAGNEYQVSICAKDASGPYDLAMRRKLVNLAKAANIPYNLDIYVNYGSDGSAALRAGANVRAALIGPGVDSSHAYERTHEEAVAHTAQLIVEFIKAA